MCVYAPAEGVRVPLLPCSPPPYPPLPLSLKYAERINSQYGVRLAVVERYGLSLVPMLRFGRDHHCLGRKCSPVAIAMIIIIVAARSDGAVLLYS